MARPRSTDTLVVAPGGKVVYHKVGAIDPLEVEAGHRQPPGTNLLRGAAVQELALLAAF